MPCLYLTAIALNPRGLYMCEYMCADLKEDNIQILKRVLRDLVLFFTINSYKEKRKFRMCKSVKTTQQLLTRQLPINILLLTIPPQLDSQKFNCLNSNPERSSSPLLQYFFLNCCHILFYYLNSELWGSECAAEVILSQVLASPQRA